MTDTALLNWSLQNILELFIILTRVGPLLFFMPVIGTPSVPAQVKILFALMISLILVPVVTIAPENIPQTAIGYVIFVACEVALGATIAFLAQFVFAAIDLAGQMTSISMGMGMAGTMDPEFGTQVSLVGYLWNIIAILIFLAINGHHMFFTTLVESFNWVQPGTIKLTEATLQGVMQGVAHMFVLSVQIMAPTAVALFLSHVAMGIIAKTVPQVPIMIVAMPVNIAIGLLFVTLSLSYLLPLLIKNFDSLGSSMTKLAVGMGG